MSGALPRPAQCIKERLRTFMGSFPFHIFGRRLADRRAGQPRAEIRRHPHNAGFEALDYLAAQWQCPLNKSKWQGLYGTAQVGEHKVVLLKPLTYMNLSGQSIAPAANFYKDPGRPYHRAVRRHHPAAGASAHPAAGFCRRAQRAEKHHRVLRHRGIRPHPHRHRGQANPQYDLAAWVLGKLPPEDRKAMTDRYPDIAEACTLLMDGNLQYAQNKFNR